MKILHLTDIHGNIGQLAKLSAQIMSSDIVVISGDITHFGKSDLAKIVIELLKKFNPDILAVAGNCDYPDIDEYLSDEGISINGIYRTIGNYVFAGISGSLIAPCVTPNVYTEEDIGKILDKFTLKTEDADKTMILVSHQPPYGTINDRTASGFQTGCKAIRRFIEKYQPAFCLTGHIHEGRGTDKIGKTIIVNPGPIKEGCFALVNTETGEVECGMA